MATLTNRPDVVYHRMTNAVSATIRVPAQSNPRPQSHMRTLANRLLATMLLGAVLTACGGGGEESAAMTADSTDARDLTRAGVDSTAQPQLKDVPLTPATTPPTSQPRPKAPPAVATPPAKADPDPVPTAPAPTSGVLAAGTTFTLASTSKVCTNTNKVGDVFTATLTDPVSGTNGATIPAGSMVNIELTQLTRSENAEQQIVMGFRVVSISVGEEKYLPDAEVVNAKIDRVAAQDGGDAAKKVAGGAVAGAIVGQILGRNRRGTLIGAAVGAAAGGAAAASAAGKFDGCVDVGSPVTVKLNAPLTVNLAH